MKLWNYKATRVQITHGVIEANSQESALLEADEMAGINGWEEIELEVDYVEVQDD